MKSKTLSLLSLVAMALAFGSTSANATGFSIMGELNYFNVKSDPAPANPPSAKMGFGGGVGVDFALGKAVSLEINALYQMRKNGGENTGIPFSTSYTSLTFPVFARIWLSPMFNFIAGGFYSKAMGNIKSEVAGISLPEMTYAQANAKTADYGAVLGLGVRTAGGFFVDGRYYLGLANLVDVVPAGTTASSKTTNIALNVGYHFGGKN